MHNSLKTIRLLQGLGRLGTPATSSALVQVSTRKIHWSNQNSQKERPLNEWHSLPPYVDPKKSYTFGRSTGHLIYKTIGESLTENAAAHPDKMAVLSLHQGIQKTFKEVKEDVDRMSKAMVETLRLKKGDSAGAWSLNVYEIIVIQLALANIGGINVTLSPLFKTIELEHALKLSDLKVIFMPTTSSVQNRLNNFHEVLSAVKLSETSLRDIVYLDNCEDGPSTFQTLRTKGYNYIMKNDGKVSQSVTDAVSPDDVCNLFFTSGTTGKPKAAASTHINMLNNIWTTYSYKRRLTAEYHPIGLVNLPLFHGFAGMGIPHLICLKPMTIIMPNYRYTPESSIMACNAFGCTDLWLVPTMAIDILNYSKKNNILLDTPETIVCGGATLPSEIMNALMKEIPSMKEIVVAYGCTETSPTITYPNHGSPNSLMNTTVGTINDFCEVKIINPVTKQVVPLGEEGEILARGHNIMRGYWKQEEKTAEAIEHGWYSTGDLGSLDKDGNLKISGRTKELIIRGGANIYPREIEELVHTFPGILNIGVCGVPDQRLGEEICAWIQMKDPKSEVTEQDIKEFCKKNLSYYKVPKYVFFVDSFPMTPSGKFQKFKMTELSIPMIKKQEEGK